MLESRDQYYKTSLLFDPMIAAKGRGSIGLHLLDQIVSLEVKMMVLDQFDK